MKKLFLFLFIWGLHFPSFSQTIENSFRFEIKSTENEYQKYVGKKVQFREPLGDAEKNIKIKANEGKDYVITAIKTQPYKDSYSKDNLEITVSFQEVNTLKTVDVTSYAKTTKKKSIIVNQIPIIFMEEYEDAKEKNIGKNFIYLETREEFSIIEMTIGNVRNTYNYLIPAVKYKCKNVKNDEISFFNASYVDGILSGEITQSSQANNLIDGGIVARDKYSFSEIKDSKNYERWANNILKKGYIDNEKNIKFQYVIPINDTLKVSSVVAYLKLWLNNKDKARFIVNDNILSGDPVKTIKGQVNLGIVASHTYFVTVGHFEKVKENLHAWADVIVEFKSNRLRLTFMVNEYDVTYSHNGIDRVPVSLENHRTRIAYHPPFSNDSNKLFWSEGFVNANVFCIESISDLISYINTSYDKSQDEKRKDIQRQSDDW